MDRSHAHERTGTIIAEPGSLQPPAQAPFAELREAESLSQSKRGHGERGMDFDCLGEIIATRRFHFVDESNKQRAVSVFVGKPQQSNGSSEYQCPFQVIGIGSQNTQLARGNDSIHALQAAFILISASLHHLNNELGGKLVWDGGNKGELGFP